MFSFGNILPTFFSETRKKPLNLKVIQPLKAQRVEKFSQNDSHQQQINQKIIWSLITKYLVPL